MKDIIKTINDRLALLEKHRAEISAELSTFHWEDDEMSAQILQSDLDHIESQITLAGFVNCTPHALNIEGLGELRPSGILPRVVKHYEDGLPLHGVRVRKNVYDPAAVVGLPDPVEGLTYIVSGMVLDALSALPAHLQRVDVYAPDTSDAIRNVLGGILAVRGLVQ